MKLIKKYQHSGQVQRSDNTNLGNQIITNLPMDESAESKFYRDLAFLSAMTEDEKESEDFYNRATNQEVYQHTVTPTDVAAQTGHIEIDPKTGDIVGYKAPTVKVNNLPGAWEQMAERAWNSPAVQLALAPLLNMPFQLGDFTKVATPFFNLENVQATNWYKDLVTRYGQKGADAIVTKISTPEFQQQFLAGRTPARARWEAERYRKIREFNSKITDPSIEGHAMLSGSPAVALEGSIHRTGTVPHDLDYMIEMPNPKRYKSINTEGLTLEAISQHPIIQRISEATGRPVKVYEIPKLFQRFPNLYKTIKGKNNIFLTDIRNADPFLGANRVAQTQVEGIPVDLFFSATSVPTSKTGAVAADYVLDWKNKIGRFKDLVDSKGFQHYNYYNPLISETSGQWSPFIFDNALIRDGLPVISNVPKLDNYNNIIPAAMNLDGQFMSVNNPRIISKLPGYHIRSLMRGNPLEQQLSKNGTIHKSVIESYMSNKPTMERLLVNQVLNENYTNVNRINYNEFRAAVQRALIQPTMSFFQGFQPSLPYPKYNLGYGPAYMLNFEDVASFAPRAVLQSVSLASGMTPNYTRAQMRIRAMADGLRHNKINTRRAQIKTELEALQKQMPQLRTNSSFSYQDIKSLPKDQQKIAEKWFALHDEDYRLSEELERIINDTGGLYYPQIDHIKRDVITKYIQEALKHSAQKGNKKALFTNSPAYARRLKKLGFDPKFTLEDPMLKYINEHPEFKSNPDVYRDVRGYLSVDVPADYHNREIFFKPGGKIKKRL